MGQKENRKEIAIKHVAVRGPQLPLSPVWDIFDQVIQGSQTPTADTPVSDLMETNRASVMQMIRATWSSYRLIVCQIYWNCGLRLASRRHPLLDSSCANHQLMWWASISSAALGLYNLIITRVWVAEKAEKLMFIHTNMIIIIFFISILQPTGWN